MLIKGGLAFWGFDDYAPQPQNRSSFSKAFCNLVPQLAQLPVCPWGPGSTLQICPFSSFYTCALILGTTAAPCSITLHATWLATDKSNYVRSVMFKDARALIFHFFFSYFSDAIPAILTVRFNYSSLRSCPFSSRTSFHFQSILYYL